MLTLPGTAWSDSSVAESRRDLGFKGVKEFIPKFKTSILVTPYTHSSLCSPPHLLSRCHRDTSASHHGRVRTRRVGQMLSMAVSSSVPCHPIPHEVPAPALFHPALVEEFAPTTGNTHKTPSTQFVRESETSQKSEGLADDADVACALLALASHSPRARESLARDTPDLVLRVIASHIWVWCDVCLSTQQIRKSCMTRTVTHPTQIL